MYVAIIITLLATCDLANIATLSLRVKTSVMKQPQAIIFNDISDYHIATVSS